MSPDTHFSVLGPVRVRRRGLEINPGQPRQSAVLASLLLRGGNRVDLSVLVNDVWGESAPASAVGSIRTYIYRLRRLLGADEDGGIQLLDGGYFLTASCAAVDLNHFNHLIARARISYAAGKLAEASNFYGDGLGLWRGTPLAGVPGPFAEMQRHVLEELHLTSMEEKLTCEVRRGHYGESIAELSALLREHPLREKFCELLITSLYAIGRQSEALTIFHSTVHLLRERLGVMPSPSLQRVHQSILANDLDAASPAGERVTVEAAPPPTSVTPAQLPAGLPDFVGRLDERRVVARLADQAVASSRPALCLVGGLAGIGKTAFAVDVARELAERFPDGQLFVDLQGFSAEGARRTPAKVLAEFLEALGVPTEWIPADTEARSRLFRAMLAERKMIVVIDNARDSEQVRDLLPGSGTSLVVVTSRHQLPGLVATHQATPLTLCPLSSGESRALLRHRVGQDWPEKEEGSVEELIDLCGRLPLALSVVAARAAYRPRASLSDMAADAVGAVSRLDAFTDEREPELDIRRSLAISYKELGEQAALMFRRLGNHPRTDFTEEAAAVLMDLPVQEVRPRLRELVHGHLVMELAPGRYRWHCLVAAYAAELAESPEEGDARDAAVRRLKVYLESARSRGAQVVRLRPSGCRDLSGAEPGDRRAGNRAACP